MSETVLRTLPRATDPTEIGRVAAGLAAAFAEEPYFTAILGRGSDTTARSRELFTLQLRHQYLPHGVVDIAEIDGELAGIGLWAPPGSAAGSLTAQARMVPAYLRLTGRRFLRAMRSELAGARMHPAFPHWYLYMLGTHPDFRGRGVGGRLLAHRTQQLGGEPAYLEASTPGSARLYARYGFVDLGEITMPGSTPLLGMWRPGVAT